MSKRGPLSKTYYSTKTGPLLTSVFRVEDKLLHAAGLDLVGAFYGSNGRERPARNFGMQDFIRRLLFYR
jgi:hypothetical protein